jgi:glucosyl-dolichyl phosphate glucuronosyltransferase
VKRSPPSCQIADAPLQTTVRISVIICTYNRCQTLAKTLASLAASVLPEFVEWEALVVDNNSSDQTREVAEDFCRQFPGRFRYIFEAHPGKSFALNTGVREAHADVVAFTDDDVTVEPTWLQNLTACLCDRQWAGAGGRTVLAEPFSPPRWLPLVEPNSFEALAASFDRGPEPCELREAPYGANMAFRKEMFLKHGGFRTDLGPRPGSQVRDEDTEFGRRLLAAGERLRYEPSAVAYHPLQKERVSKRHLLAWWFDYGRAAVRQWRRKPDVWGIPREYFSVLRMAGLCLPQRIFRWIFAADPRRRFGNKCWAWAMAGQIVETYRLGRNAKTLESDPVQAANVQCDAQINARGKA